MIGIGDRIASDLHKNLDLSPLFMILTYPLRVLHKVHLVLLSVCDPPQLNLSGHSFLIFAIAQEDLQGLVVPY